MKTLLIKATNTIPTTGSYISGIGKSTIYLLDALNAIEDKPFEILLYANGLKSMRFDFYNWNFRHKIIPFPASLNINGKGIESFWRKHFIPNDLFHCPDNICDVSNSEKFVITIHDCDKYENTSDSLIKKQYERAVHLSKGIVTCSEYSKAEIVSHFNVDPQKITVIHWGVDKNKFKYLEENACDKIIHKFNINAPFFFACSCKAPRKNIETALRAYRIFNNKKNTMHKFVLSWGNPPKRILQEFAREIENEKIIFLPYVNDEELVALYNKASLFIYPSKKEGFGMPILEAYSCGTPVMVCRNSSIPEVAQDAGIYVMEDSPNEMAEVMEMFDKSLFDVNTFHNKVKKILANFSWDHTAKQYIKFYQKYI